MAATTTNRPQFEENDDGETLREVSDIGTLALLNKSEIDQQIATAKRWPRSLKSFLQTAVEMVSLDEKTAEECIYALPRRERDPGTGEWIQKTIEGPSARLAEVLAYAWTNCRAGARVVSEEGEFVTAQGAFYDLQNNVAISYEVKRRITDKRGKRYSADMVGVTANAACSIALRNAVMKGIPKALWKKVYDTARATVAGDFHTLASRRTEALKQFQIYGATPQMVFELLGIRGSDDISLDHLVTLKGILNAIREGETTPEQVFAPPAPAHAASSDAMGRNTTTKASSLDEKYRGRPSSEGETVAAQSANPPQARTSAVPPTVESSGPKTSDATSGSPFGHEGLFEEEQ